MEYSKAELEELTYNAEVNLSYIKNYDNGIGLMKKIDEEIPYLDIEKGLFVIPSMRIEMYLERLSERLPVIRDCIFATDDMELANETYNLISPVWEKYKASTYQPERAKVYAQTISTTIDKIKWKIDRYNKAHPQQPDTLINRPSTKDEREDKPTKSIIDTDKLQTLFTDSFFADDYDIQDTHNKSLKLSRYDKLCQRLEMILTDTDKKPDQKTIGAIAYMIYCSPYTKAEYRKPKREGVKGGFANLIRVFFDIVGKDRPSDTRPNKYKKPIEDMVLYFGDILKWE
jgi:hypothetical protein